MISRSDLDIAYEMDRMLTYIRACDTTIMSLAGKYARERTANKGLKMPSPNEEILLAAREFVRLHHQYARARVEDDINTLWHAREKAKQGLLVAACNAYGADFRDTNAPNAL